jgi:hypothetical protein
MRLWKLGATALSLSALSLALLVGCSSKPSTSPPDDDNNGDSTTKKAEPVMPGKAVVKGKVTFAGKEPDIEKANTDLEKMVIEKKKDNADHCLCKQAKERGDAGQQKWRINPKNKGVENAVVFLIPEKDTFFACSADDEAVKRAKDYVFKVHQPYCAFHPHIGVLFLEYRDKDKKTHKTGSKLVVYNDTNTAEGGMKGGVSHNTKWSGPATESGGSKAVAVGGDMPIEDLRAKYNGPLSLNCDLHPWMNAYIWVLDHPYFAVTDKDGNYAIKDAPKGKVRIIAWHEGHPEYFMNENGPKGEPITLKDGDNDEKDFTAKE